MAMTAMTRDMLFRLANTNFHPYFLDTYNHISLLMLSILLELLSSSCRTRTVSALSSCQKDIMLGFLLAHRRPRMNNPNDWEACSLQLEHEHSRSSSRPSDPPPQQAVSGASSFTRACFLGIVVASSPCQSKYGVGTPVHTQEIHDSDNGGTECHAA
jgi:hypothetical protein